MAQIVFDWRLPQNYRGVSLVATHSHVWYSAGRLATRRGADGNHQRDCPRSLLRTNPYRKIARSIKDPPEDGLRIEDDSNDVKQGGHASKRRLARRNMWKPIFRLPLGPQRAVGTLVERARRSEPCMNVGVSLEFHPTSEELRATG